MQLSGKTIILAWLAIVTWLTGCGHTLRIRHIDPTTKNVIVQVSNQPEEKLSFGDEVCLSLSEGLYLVDAYSQENRKNIWSNDGKSWEIYLEEDAELTLMQPKSLPPVRSVSSPTQLPSQPSSKQNPEKKTNQPVDNPR